MEPEQDEIELEQMEEGQLMLGCGDPMESGRGYLPADLCDPGDDPIGVSSGDGAGASCIQ